MEFEIFMLWVGMLCCVDEDEDGDGEHSRSIIQLPGTHLFIPVSLLYFPGTGRTEHDVLKKVVPTTTMRVEPRFVILAPGHIWTGSCYRD